MEKVGAFTERATAEGEWRPGDPATGLQATPMLSAYFNMLQRELLAVLSSAGEEPDIERESQIAESIKKLAGYNVTTITSSDSPAPINDRSGMILVDATNGPVVVQMPLASNSKGASYGVFRLDSSEHDVTVIPATGDSIEGLPELSVKPLDQRSLWSAGGNIWRRMEPKASTEQAGMLQFASLEEHQAGESTEKAANPAGVRAMLNASAYEFEAIGKPFVVFDHLPGVELPSNEGSAKFVKLTAGETGAGGYNEGLLINETVATSNGRVVATAEIAGGPNQGGIVHLLNTEGRHVRPGENSGAVAFDQMQQITGSFESMRRQGIGNGAFTPGSKSTQGIWSNGSAAYSGRTDFDSADSPGARTGSYTEVMHIEGTAMLRIE